MPEIVSAADAHAHVQSAGARAEPPRLRLGVLKYGTVNWEINVIKHHALDANLPNSLGQLLVRFPHLSRQCGVRASRLRLENDRGEIKRDEFGVETPIF